MSKPKILIVGAGAVGLAQGFHLANGAEITYLVRPGRKPAFSPPKKLYDYKENTIRTFDGYRVVESTAEVAGEEFYCVFDTLDGYTARSEGGAATIKSVGDLIRDSKNTFVVYDAFGLDIDLYYETTMGLPKNRLFLAASMLAHQPTTSIPIPPSADKDLIAQADLLYSANAGNTGLVVINTQPALTQKFEHVYNKNGKLKVQKIPGFAGRIGTTLAFPQLVAWNLDGYQDIEHLRQNTEIWNLLIKAQKEVLTLPRFGWTGWALSWIVGSWVTGKMLSAPVAGAAPLSYKDFNAFHHGGKVAKQDIEMLEDLVAEGEKKGHKMPALREIVRRGNETQEAKAKAGTLLGVPGSTDQSVRKRV
ncbi:hypothetical protein IQ07DRAFT_588398 [Pyrenochaeta sp. DS3sAY3a]|nr:hypothetical protein IQ07DRAFT_588398 [Pyrenochaeta sp. DS3sAY3a]